MIEMRGHHLLCSLTFAGRGYSRAFERDFDKIIQRILRNELIRIVAGPDEICASVQACAGSHCHEKRITVRDELALQAISSMLDIELHIGSILWPADLFNDNYRRAFSRGEVRKACHDCQWSALCDGIADNDFLTTRLIS